MVCKRIFDILYEAVGIEWGSQEFMNMMKSLTQASCGCHCCVSWKNLKC